MQITVAVRSSDGRFSITVAVPGLLEEDDPDVDACLDGQTAEQEDAILEAWGGVVKITTAKNSLVCSFNAQPDTAIPIKIKVVR